MKTKYLQKYILTSAVVLGALTSSIAIQYSVQHKSQSKWDTNAVLQLANAFAEGSGGPQDDSCRAKIKDHVDGAPQSGKFHNGPLDHVHRQLYRFNKIETADVEMIFCRLDKVMGVDPNLASLPQTISKSDPMGSTISLVVSKPSESFAVAAGYEAKAVISKDDVVFMTLWWAGSGDSSKGYLIQGANPMARDGMTRLRYLQWDRSSDDQSIRILATQFASSYLGSLNGATGSQSGGDDAHFARATYNTASKAVYGQSLEIRNQSGAFKCIKTQFSGTLGGTLAAYRPAVGTPDLVTDSNKYGTHVDGVTGINDDPSIPDGGGGGHNGTVVNAPATLPQAFDYSCNDLNSAGTSAFAGGNVSFTMLPSAVFPH